MIQSKLLLGVNDEWIDTFGKIKGKWGSTNFISCLPYVDIYPKGSMENELFMQMTEMGTLDLYLPDMVLLKVEFENVSQLVKGPVL